ncbi:MAG: IPT/TIG domain-containing protein [Chryseolinea sp.]
MNRAALYLFVILSISCVLSCKDNNEVGAKQEVTAINPMSGGYNTIVTIRGSNFLPSVSDNAVTFNGVAAVVRSVTATSITVSVPVRAGSGVVVINGVDTGMSFTYYPDIFVVGYEVTGTVTSAKMWKNGMTTVLSKAGEFATANGIAFDSDNIYIAGYALEGGYTVARYWKNNVDTPLPGSELSSTVNSVSVVGSDVYLVGSHAKTGAINIADYWKNQTLVEVEDDGFPSFAKTHTIVGENVYLGGGQFVDGANVATYWKNGKANRVSEIPSLINGIFVQDDDVYLVGYEAPTPTTKFATYWKNGTAVRLTSGTYQAEASAIKVVGNDIYITGYEHNAAHFFVAKFWKNGVETELADGTNSSYTTSIDVLGGDVYIAGAEHNGINASVAKYWKNGISFPMTNGGRNAFAYDIILR